MSEQVPSPIRYTATATAYGGREGRVASDDGLLDVTVAPPPGLGGKGGATNPEQLFAAGYAACFGSAVSYIARARKIATTSPIEITCRVGIGPVGGGTTFGLTVALEAKLPGVERALAEEIVHKAHELCPYSNATRGNVPVAISVV